MTFIKTQNVVINTSYLVAVRLDNETIADEKNVSVLLATLQFLLFSRIPLFKILTITGILDFGLFFGLMSDLFRV
ncbi:hypothetical protein FACHB389_13930 [Nostoc calcicola FACHB-389]|nr:hypothetical protein FACHB389_13930 [Nostoc calcicola FACHB-389]